MNIETYFILNHIDSPIKFFLWTKGELMLFGFPFLAGILFDVFFVGISLSILNAYGVSRYKRMFGKGMLQAIVYRFFPPSHRFKGFPPSHIRYLFG